MKNRTYKNFLIYHFDEIDSTNSKALQMAQDRQIFDRAVILSDRQKSGRGRMNRVWSSPQGNLYFSLVLQPQVYKANIEQISFVAIAALRLALKPFCGDFKIENKWPNDLLIAEKKVAGLLLESEFSQKKCEFIVLGIGVNIAFSPDNTIFPAANLSDFNIDISPQKLLENFLDKFEELYQNWIDFGFAKARRLWLEGAYKFGEKIFVSAGENEKISGIFKDFDQEGALILLGDDGLEKKFTAAEIF